MAVLFRLRITVSAQMSPAASARLVRSKRMNIIMVAVPNR